MIKASIIGGSGYAGGEVLRLLLDHPQVEVGQATSESHLGEYVYQQQPCPADVVGVDVTLSVIDANGNFREIGTATTDAMGSYGFTWTPDIPGDYILVANFAGSNSYYTSSAQTYFHAAEAVAPEPTPVYQQPVDNTMTIIGVGVAMIVAIAIVGALILLTLRKR